MEPHKVVYVAPTRAALAARLREHAARVQELASALPPDFPEAARSDEADVAARTALHRMVLDLDEQCRRCESAAGLERRTASPVAAPTSELPTIFTEGA